MPRKPGTTLKKSKDATSAADTTPEGERAATRRNLRGRRGGLKDMPDMPFDILVEIFAFMHPRDLLNLARTTKAFRAFLMSRKSAPMWKAARKQVEGLPDCPPFLSEPQYANLLFFSNCYNCSKSNLKSNIWELFVRYCPACKEKMLQAKCYEYNRFRGLVRIETSVQDFAIATVTMPRTKGSSYKTEHVHVPEYEQAEAKWNTLTEAADKVKFAEEHVAMLRARKLPVAALQAWKETEMDARAFELDNLKYARVESIIARLRQEGWGDELDRMSSGDWYRFKENKLVKKPQKLTDASWQSARPGIVAIMERLKQARIDQEHFNIYRKRLHLLADHVHVYENSLLSEQKPVMLELQAGVIDLAKMHPFVDLVEAPLTTQITEAHFVKFQGAIPTQKAAWFEARKQEFLEKARAVIPYRNDEAVLSLAILAFTCRKCDRKDLRWPNVLAHSCARVTEFGAEAPFRRAVHEVSLQRDTRHYEWMASDDMFSANAQVRIARDVVAACGLDPETATYEDMEQRGARLVCMDCTSISEFLSRESRDWKDAVAHKCPTISQYGGLYGDNRRGESNWKVLDPALTARVIEVERGQRDLFSDLDSDMSPGPTLCCARCEYRRRGNGVITHVRTFHSVAEPRLGEHYYEHPDARPWTELVELFSPRLKPRFISRAEQLVRQGLGLFAPSVYE